MLKLDNSIKFILRLIIIANVSTMIKQRLIQLSQLTLSLTSQYFLSLLNQLMTDLLPIYISENANLIPYA